ncbi:MAG: glycosyltransferase [Desulfobacteraceae bacterium]|nr:MAG: glycosyltransferase [Desulfobacteraceae bacterium]
MITVSIIIPTYNRAGQIGRAVSSVLEQSFKDFELIIVDDGSTDNTSDLLKNNRSSIVYIRHHRNLGVSAARNTGILCARGDLIAFLDSDDYWLKDKLSNQVEFFARNPQALICQTQEYWHRNGKRVNPQKKHLKPSGLIFEQSLKICLVSPSAVMMRRCLFDEVGLFDEKLPVCEDYDLWVRISCKHPIYLIDRYLLVRQGGNPDQLSSSTPGMDRYRIWSLLKLIKDNSLKPAQSSAVLKQLVEKCSIYGQGCIKRGKLKEGRFFISLPDRVVDGKDTAAISSLQKEMAATWL